MVFYKPHTPARGAVLSPSLIIIRNGCICIFSSFSLQRVEIVFMGYNFYFVFFCILANLMLYGHYFFQELWYVLFIFYTKFIILSYMERACNRTGERIL